MWTKCIQLVAQLAYSSFPFHSQQTIMQRPGSHSTQPALIPRPPCSIGSNSLRDNRGCHNAICQCLMLGSQNLKICLIFLFQFNSLDGLKFFFASIDISYWPSAAKLFNSNFKYSLNTFESISFLSRTRNSFSVFRPFYLVTRLGFWDSVLLSSVRGEALPGARGANLPRHGWSRLALLWFRDCVNIGAALCLPRIACRAP